jgi:hypothetical protein
MKIAQVLTTRPYGALSEMVFQPRVAPAATNPPAAEGEAFANALLGEFGPGDQSMALWARTRALLRYIHQPKATSGAGDVSEALSGPQIATNGYSSNAPDNSPSAPGSPDKLSSELLKALTLIAAAAKHPLASDGSFAEGFDDTLRIARRAFMAGMVN